MKAPSGQDRPAEIFIALGLPILSRAVRHAAADLLVGEGRSVAEHDRCQPGKRHHEQSLLADPARRAALGRAGRLSIEKRFGSPTMAAAFLRVTARLARPAA